MIHQLIKDSPTTYAKFRAWITVIYKNDIIRVQKFEAMNEIYLIPIFIKYLEQEQKIPILEALNYYSKLRNTKDYTSQTKTMIMYEFTRIEYGKTTNYNIF